MNKTIKRMVVGACICIGIGIVILGVASVTGGISEAKELIQNGGITVGFSSDDLLEYNTETRHNILLDDMRTVNMDIELAAGDFKIIESDVTDIVVESNKKIESFKEGDTIYIHTPKKFYFMKRQNL